MPREREDRLVVELGVVEAVEQVNAARSGGREAHAQPARVLGVTTGGKGGRLLVADLNEAAAILVGA